MTYQVSVIRDPSELERELPEWREFIAGRTTGCNVFNDPSVIQFAIERENAEPFIVMIRRGGSLQCVAPFRVQESALPLRFSVFTLTTAQPRMLSLFGNGFPFASDADTAACCALAFHAVESANFDISFLYAVETESPLWGYCSSANHERGSLRFTRPSRMIDRGFRIELPATFTDYEAMLGPKTRASLKRRARKLVAEHGAKLIRVTSPDQVSDFLRAADEIDRDSWQAKENGRIKRDTADQVARFEHLARINFLRCYLLTTACEPLAFQVGYIYGDMFYACDFAFAQSKSSLGAGAVLMYLMLEEFYRDRTVRTVDLGTGDSPQKHSFRGMPYNVADYYVLPRNRWRYFAALQRGLSEIEFFARSALVKVGLDNGVRRFLKSRHTRPATPQ